MGGKILEKWRKKSLKKAENFEGPSSSEGNHITPTNCKIFLDVVMRLESLPTDSKNNRDRAQEGLRRKQKSRVSWKFDDTRHQFSTIQGHFATLNYDEIREERDYFRLQDIWKGLDEEEEP